MTISRQAAIDDLHGRDPSQLWDTADIEVWVNALPSAQPEPYLDSIVSEIKKTISETKENGKYHCANIRINGEMICFGLQLALEIIEEKRNGQSDKQTGGD